MTTQVCFDCGEIVYLDRDFCLCQLLKIKNAKIITKPDYVAITPEGEVLVIAKNNITYHYAKEYDPNHDCEKMGCGSTGHIVFRGKLVTD